MTIIHILNHQTGELIGHLDSESDKFFWDAKHVHGLDGEHSQQFTMPADLEEAALLDGRTRFLIPLEDDGFEEFIQFESDTQMEDEKTVYGTPYYKEMDKKYILPPGEYTGTVEKLANLVLPFVKHKLGVFEDIRDRTITVDRHIGAYSFLEKISSEFDLEMQFRLTTAGSRVTGRFTDFLKRIGEDTRKEIVLGKDLLAINKKVHSERIVTGLFCIGPEREDGTRLTTTIFDEEAFQRWNEDGEHIIDIYEPESSDVEMTLAELDKYGRTELNKRIASVYEYTVTAASLEELFPHEKVRLGDRVRLKNPEFSPPLYADARVIRIERSLTDPDAKTYNIGEIVSYDEEEILQTFRKLQQQYNMRVIRSAEKPPGSPNKIWIQIVPAADGKPAQEVPHIWSTELNNWVKIAPTTAADLNAEPLIPSLPTPPDPNIHPKYVDTSSEIAELKLWNPNTLQWDTVQGPPGVDGLDGYTPVKGTDYFDGIDGQDGTDGTSSYLWVRYSQNADGRGFIDDPTGAKYIGVSTTQIGIAPTEPTAYRWTLIKGTDGLPGEPGDDGRTSYLHIKYSNDGGATFTANSGESVGAWIGTYVDFNAADSASPSAYTWNKVKGEKGDPGYTPIKGTDYFDGKDGQNGVSSYLWIRYSQNADGSGFVDSPTGAKYIGVATTTTATAPTTASSYKWTLIKGTDGLPGEPGDNGKTSYLHIKYSNDGGVTFTANAGEDAGAWIGTYVDFTSADSTNPAAYIWNLVKGEKGDPGTNGVGVSSIVEQYYLSTSATTQSGGTWSTSVPAWIDGRFMWTRSVISYTNGNSTTTPAVNVTGAKGPTGSTGTGVSKVDVIYYLSTSSTSLSGGSWSTTAPAWVDGRYMWSKTVVTYTNGTTSETAAANITGAKGETGGTGPAGEMNLVNNPSKSGNTNGWGDVTLDSQVFVDGSTIPVLKNVSSSNVHIRYNNIEIESSKIYELSVWLKADVTTGLIYFGFYMKNAAYALINSYQVPVTNGVKGSATTNPYGMAGYQPHTNWRKYTFYLVPDSIDTSDTNLMRKLGLNNQANYTYPADAKFIDFRYLNWNNTSTAPKTLWAALPEMKEVDFAVLEANRARNAAEISQTTADGKNTVFYGTVKPSLAGRKVNDIWFETDNHNKMHRFNGSDFVAEEFGMNAIADLSITNAKIADATIQSSKIANLDAGKITSGIIDSVTYRSGYGTAQRFELSGGTATFTEDMDFGLQSVTKINDDGVNVQYKEGTTIDYSARLMGMGLLIGQEAIGYKASYLGDHLTLDEGGLGELSMIVQSTYGQVVAKKGLRIQGQTQFNYLSDGGYSILGGQVFIPKGGEPVTTQQETGYCATSGTGHPSSQNTAFLGVNFRTKKTYTPSSVSLSTLTSNLAAKVTEITSDGFLLYMTTNNGSGFYYWRGRYTA